AELTLAHARSREQFGRPIGRFQAVQSHVVAVAGETAAARMAVDWAAAGLNGTFAVDFARTAVAKIRTGSAATVAASRAHQVHGAVGTTPLHDLGAFTRAVWAWRDEYGSEHHWSRRLGEWLRDHADGGVWPLVTAL
ncbi:MAG: acyl-CoA dehydrogenase family protein, partial [Egibacteraceae bacterium]